MIVLNFESDYSKLQLNLFYTCWYIKHITKNRHTLSYLSFSSISVLDCSRLRPRSTDLLMAFDMTSLLKRCIAICTAMFALIEMHHCYMFSRITPTLRFVVANSAQICIFIHLKDAFLYGLWSYRNIGMGLWKTTFNKLKYLLYILSIDTRIRRE